MNVLAMNAGGGSSRAMLYTVTATPELEPPPALWTGEREENDAPLADLFRDFPTAAVDLVAHRVVHGGLDPKRGLEAVIDDAVLAMIRAAEPLAASHDRAALDGIAYTQKRFPFARQIAVFSHRDVMPRVLKLLGRNRAKIVSVHLGSGASACAFDGERIVETTMGMTPMDGAMMGTRAGAVDSGIIFHLLRNGVDAATIEDDLNHKSGLFGVSGLSLDTRVLLDASAKANERARFALDLYAYRMAQCIGSLFSTIGGCDALSFTGPIGQHMPQVRAPIVARLAYAGFALDAEHNAAFGEDAPGDGPIHVRDSRPVFVIRTLEEWAMVRRAIPLLS